MLNNSQCLGPCEGGALVIDFATGLSRDRADLDGSVVEPANRHDLSLRRDSPQPRGASLGEAESVRAGYALESALSAGWAEAKGIAKPYSQDLRNR